MCWCITLDVFISTNISIHKTHSYIHTHTHAHTQVLHTHANSAWYDTARCSERTCGKDDHLYDNHTYLPAQVTFKDAVKGSQVFFFWKYPFFIDHLYDYHTYLPTQITLKSALKSSRMLFFPFFLHFFFGGKDDQSLRRPHLFTDSSHLQKCC